MKKIRTVLSLFDGISAGRVALDRVGIEYDKFYASEIDKYAISITEHNFPDTIQLGDVTAWKEWDIDWSTVDLLMGGSPCQNLSFAGNGTGLDGEKSSLFYTYVDILNHIKKHNPEVKFLLENVKMKKEWEEVITNCVEVPPILINSSLLSAQNRKRLYWTNIPNVVQPEDKGILLKDILEHSGNVVGRIVGRKINPETGKRDDYNSDIEIEQYVEKRLDEKNGCLTTVQKDNVVLLVDRDKSYCLDANYHKGASYKQYKEKSRRQLIGCIQVGEADLKGHDSIKRVYSPEGKAPCLTTMGGGHREPKVSVIREKSKTVRSSGRESYDKHEWDSVDELHWRKLTPLECERLQTFPDKFTLTPWGNRMMSNSQRYKALGNSWTVDVIAHIFSFMGTDSNTDHRVLF